MRILCIPNITKTSGNLMLDSSFKLMRAVVERMKEEAFFYWILPSCVKENVPEMPKNSKVIFEGDAVDSFAYRDNHIDSTVLMKFSRRFGDYPIDAVITRRKGGPLEVLKLNDENRRSLKGGKDNTWIPVFMLEPNVEKLNEAKGLIDVMSYASAIPVFHTELEKKKAQSLMLDYLGPTVVKNVNAKVIPLGLRFDKIDQLTGDIEKGRNVIKVFYGARMNKWKKTREIFDVYGHIKSSGIEGVEFIATTITGDMSAFSEAQVERWGKYFRLYTNCSWEDYLKYAKASHVTLVASPREALGVAFIEALYLGVITIFPNREWVYQVVPRNYPFIYSNKNEMYTMLKYVIENYDEAWSKFEHIPDYIKEKFQNETTNDYLLQCIREEVANHRKQMMYRVGGATASMMARAIGLKDYISWHELTQNVESFSRQIKFPQSKHFRRPNQISDYEIYIHMIENEGFRDLCDSEYPNFIRERL